MLQLKWSEEDSLMKKILMHILETHIKEYQQSIKMVNEYRNEAEETCNEELAQINYLVYNSKKPVASSVFADIRDVLENDLAKEKKNMREWWKT